MNYHSQDGKGRVCLYFTLAFLAACFAVFGPFWITGRGFVWQFDGLGQHLIAFRDFGIEIRAFLRGVLHGELVLPEYRSTIGLGDSEVTATMTLPFADPTSLIAAFFPAALADIALTLAVIVRLYIGGICFVAFCRYKRWSTMAAITGSIVFLFASFTAFGVVRHPYFASAIMTSPLLFLALEKAAARKCYRLLPVAIFATGLTGYYFLYMNAVVGGAFYLVRYAMSHANAPFRSWIVDAAKTAAAAALGAAMSAVVLIPIVLNFLASAREGGTGTPLRDLISIDWNDLLGTPALSVSTATSWEHLGLAAISILALLGLFMGRQDRRRRVLIASFVALIALLYLLPLGGLVMNGLSYPSRRWTYLICLFAGLAVARFLDSGGARPGRNAAIAYGAVVAGTLACCFLVPKSHLLYALVGWLFLATYSLIMIVGRDRTSRANGKPNRKEDSRIARAPRLKAAIILVVVILNVSALAAGLYSPAGMDYASQFLRFGQAKQEYDRQLAIVKCAARNAKAKTRIDAHGLLDNLPVLGNYRGLSTYWSTTNGAYASGLKDLGNSDMMQTFRISGVDERFGLQSALGAKYYVGDRDSSKALSSTYKYKNSCAAVNGYATYENGLALPLIYGDDQVPTEAEYASLSVMDQEASLIGASVNPEQRESGSSRLSPALWKALDVTQTMEHASYSNKVLSVREKWGGFRVDFKGIPDSQTYVVLRNLRNRDAWTTRIVSIANGLKRSHLSLGDTNYWSFPRDSLVINLGYSASALQSARISFGSTGRFDIDTIEVISFPRVGVEAQLRNVRQQGILAWKASGNRFTVDLANSRSEYVVVGLPYDKGWTARVDGQIRTIRKAYGAKMAIRVGAGAQNLELKYSIPGARTGLALSAVSIVGFVVLEIRGARRRRAQR